MYSFSLGTRCHLHSCISFSYGLLRFQSTIASAELARYRSQKPHKDSQSFEVDCRSSGSVKVDIFHQQHLSDPSAPLIIYLPPAGVHLSHIQPPIPSYLLSGPTALARINYRWDIPRHCNFSSNYKLQPDYHPFPFPIHDTLQAWSFITETFLPSFEPKLPPTNSEPQLEISHPFPIVKEPEPLKKRLIIIYGEFLGATIATSLALTECFDTRIRQSAHEIRLIAKQGVYDWVDIGTTIVKSRKNLNRYQNQIYGPWWDKETLLTLREHLFATPLGCLDAFASPTLFFRSPGIVAPGSWQELTQKSTYSPPEIKKHDLPEKFEVEQDELALIQKDSWAELQRISKICCSTSMSSIIDYPPALIDSKIPYSLFLYRDFSRKESRLCSLVDAKISRSKLSIVTPMRQAKYFANLLKESWKCTRGEMAQVQRLEDDLVEEARVVRNWLAAAGKE